MNHTRCKKTYHLLSPWLTQYTRRLCQEGTPPALQTHSCFRVEPAWTPFVTSPCTRNFSMWCTWRCIDTWTSQSPLWLTSNTQLLRKILGITDHLSQLAPTGLDNWFSFTNPLPTTTLKGKNASCLCPPHIPLSEGSHGSFDSSDSRAPTISQSFKSEKYGTRDLPGIQMRNELSELCGRLW